jgi:hypothetical protein
MTTEIDVYRSAQLLIERHGKDAPIHAAMRADERCKAGDFDGAMVWKRILRAIDTLQATSESGSVTH